MESYQLAWLLYSLGGLGCGLAAWFLFRRFGREWGHFFMISLWVLLLTPYALDETMTMAPAIFILIMDGLVDGFDSVKPITMLLLGLWLIGLILSLLFQLASRRSRSKPPPPKQRRSRRPLPADELDLDEQVARDELLEGDIPLRAER